jgi:hypothetical protein
MVRVVMLEPTAHEVSKALPATAAEEAPSVLEAAEWSAEEAGTAVGVAVEREVAAEGEADAVSCHGCPWGRWTDIKENTHCEIHHALFSIT